MWPSGQSSFLSLSFLCCEKEVLALVAPSSQGSYDVIPGSATNNTAPHLRDISRWTWPESDGQDSSSLTWGWIECVHFSLLRQDEVWEHLLMCLSGPSWVTVALGWVARQRRRQVSIFPLVINCLPMILAMTIRKPKLTCETRLWVKRSLWFFLWLPQPFMLLLLCRY